MNAKSVTIRVKWPVQIQIMTQVLACPGLFPFHFLTEKALWRAWTGQGYELLDGLVKYANVSLCFHPRCDFFVSSLYFVTMEIKKLFHSIFLIQGVQHFYEKNSLSSPITSLRKIFQLNGRSEGATNNERWQTGALLRFRIGCKTIFANMIASQGALLRTTTYDLKT